MKSQKELWLEGFNFLAMKKYDMAETALLIALHAPDDNPIDRHFAYNVLIDLYYKRRDEQEDAVEKCIHYCKEDIARLTEFLKYDKRDNYGGKYYPPQCPSIQRLAIIYEKNGQYQEAIDLCNLGIRLGLKEDTKGGYQGRIEKLKKKLNEKIQKNI